MSTNPGDPNDSVVAFRVDEGEAGQRLDKLVTRHLGNGGRRKVTELFEKGAVRVGGRIAKKSVLARAGDDVSVTLHALILPEADLPLDVRLETPVLVVVNKPAAQPTVPARDGDTGTLASALLARYPEMANVGYRTREPGLLQRLDTETSGLLIAARSGAAFTSLRRALGEGRIEKRYLAVVLAEGLPDRGTVATELFPDPKDSRRVIVPKEATERIGQDDERVRVTGFEKLRVAGEWALVEVEARHAYRHQVRVHLASIGHPIAGDALYGGPVVPLRAGRHALHASYVAWTGDDVVGAFAVDCPLPEDLDALGFGR